MKNSILILFMFFMICCTPKKVNQYVKINGAQLRNGLWLESYDSDIGKLQAKGKYYKGEKVGIWKTSFQGKKYQKDVIKDGIIKTKIYHPNGKIMQKGQSRTDISSNERHWYYFGDWKYYDDKGKILFIRKYVLGKKVDSVNMKK
ncbi:hypothetical protein EIH07_07675 [Chryseobacterium taklimakanense]|uniref:hypothetical protein n=1 Tax=Chryseobacterium taklimakanense TaxID=536441 RepID=UPI000F5F7417|nr:hypothetical protein [Chryseobacterium taklimakanense]AZI22923.1 hypothetical protein EIH07_07675 [Chryseobacterium taklimakanense]